VVNIFGLILLNLHIKFIYLLRLLANERFPKPPAFRPGPAGSNLATLAACLGRQRFFHSSQIRQNIVLTASF
jgi:hypothetical protein